MVPSITRVALLMFVVVSVVVASPSNWRMDDENQEPRRRRHARYASDVKHGVKDIAADIKSDKPPVRVGGRTKNTNLDLKHNPKLKRNEKRSQVPNKMSKRKGVRGEIAEAHHKKRHPMNSTKPTPFHDVVGHIRESTYKKHPGNLPKLNVAGGRTAKD